MRRMREKYKEVWDGEYWMEDAFRELFVNLSKLRIIFWGIQNIYGQKFQDFPLVISDWSELEEPRMVFKERKSDWMIQKYEWVKQN